MSWADGSDLLIPHVGDIANAGTYDYDNVFGAYKAAIVEMRSQYPFGLDPIPWDTTVDGVGPLLVADDADETDHGHGPWVPTAGGAANPVLGTGGFIVGEIWQHGTMMDAGVTAQFGPNTTSVSYTNVAVNISTNVFTRSGHTLANGMAVLISNRGTAVLPAADPTNFDGSYLVRNSNTGADTFELEITAGSGTSIDVTGTAPGASIHLDAVAASKGTGGFWRFRNPAPALLTFRQRQGIVGGGHMVFPGGGPFGPGTFRTVALHSPTSVSAQVCGLVVGANLPPSSITPESAAWSIANSGAADRSIDVANDTLANVRQELATLVTDLQASTAHMTGDNVGPLFPYWTSAINGARFHLAWRYPRT